MSLTLRLAALGLLLFADKVFLNAFVAFDRAQSAQGLGALVRDVQHWGFRSAVAMAASVILLALVRKTPALTSAAAAIRASDIRLRWLAAHVVLMACLAPLTFWLYPDDARSLPLITIVSLWLIFASGAVTCAVLAMSPWPLWVKAARSLGAIWPYAAAIAIVSAGAIRLSQQLWQPMANITFALVRLVLLPVIPTLHADPVSHILSTPRFAVEVSELCSGLEGMGLILAFCIAWLVFFRREYIFPRAILILPVGLFAIFVLNILRIAVLVLIGDAGHPDVAQYGFHSQAGWIAFNTVACGLAFFSRRSRWLNRCAVGATAATAHNPTATFLMPLLAILVAGTLSHAMSAHFETFYPLRLIAALLMLGWCWRGLTAINWRMTWRGPAVGAGIFILWALLGHYALESAPMPEALALMSPGGRAVWIVSRVLASVVTVPIAEELAYRGYLLRRWAAADFEAVPFEAVRWPALLVSSVVFGLMHGSMWPAGIAAGLAYGLLVMRRGSLGEAVAAHATTNALIAVAVLAAGQWQLW